MVEWHFVSTEIGIMDFFSSLEVNCIQSEIQVIL